MSYQLDQDELLTVLEEEFNVSPSFDVVEKILDEYIDVNSVEDIAAKGHDEVEMKEFARNELVIQILTNQEEIKHLLD